MVQKNITFTASLNTSKMKADINDLQKSLSSLNIKDSKLTDNFKNIFSELNSELEKYQNKINSGFKTKSDVSSLEKSSQKINNLMDQLIDTFKTIDGTKVDLSKVFNIDKKSSSDISKIDEEIKKLKSDLKALGKINLSGLNKSLTELTTPKAKEGGDLVKNLIQKGDIEQAKNLLDELINKQKQTFNMLEGRNKSTANVTKNIEALQQMKNVLNQIDTTKIEKINSDIAGLQANRVDILNQALDESNKKFQGVANGASKLAENVRFTTTALNNSADSQRRMNSELATLTSRVQAYFGISNTIDLFQRTVRSAFQTVKDLDEAMTETAVVTDFSVGDMWEELPRYTAAANELGTTTLGAYQTMTLFYQQGLKTNEVFDIGTETMKMARIAGMDYTKATDLMTAALRGFNMELNNTSAQRINDVYSELAAITAADTEEIADAMTRTASIADSAGMEFETTSAFLSQMIETTREAPENLGTAMKTIIARFQELKKAPSEITEVDGEEVSLNKIDTALKSIGITLTDTTGQFRDLDDVFLEISAKWDSLDKNTQRYIATVAAGSRQQSRFIAMMSNYDRTMELVDAANNSAGASQKQFEKTTESLESKLNKLKNAWNEFTMGIGNNQVIKFGVDLLTKLFGIINDITGVAGDGVGIFLKLGAAILTLKAGKGILNSILGSMGKAFGEGALIAGGMNNTFGKAGQQAGIAFSNGINTGISSVSFKTAQSAKFISNQLKNALNKSAGSLNVSQFLGIFKKIPEAMRQEMLTSAPGIIEPLTNSIKTQLMTQLPNLGEEGADKLIQQFKQALMSSKGDMNVAINSLNQQIRNQLGETGKNFRLQNLQLDAGTINQLTNSFGQLGGTLGKVGSLFNDFANMLSSLGLDGAANAIRSFGMVLSSLSGILVTTTLLFPKMGVSALTAGTVAGEGGVIATAGWSAFIPILLAVGAVIAALSLTIESNEEKIDSMNKHLDTFSEKTSEIDSNISTIKGLKDEFENLSKGVNDAGENIGLTADEYSRYNEIVNELVTLNPQLLQGYTAEGNAIVDRNEAIREGINLQEEYRQSAIRNLVSDDSMKDIIEGVQASIEEARKDYSKEYGNDDWAGKFSEAWKNIGGPDNVSIKDIIPDFVNLGSASNEQLQEIYNKRYEIIKNAYSNLGKEINGIEITDDSLAEFSDLLNNDLGNIVQNINEAKQPLIDALTQYANLDDVIDGESLFEFIPDNMSSMLQKGISDVADQLAAGEIEYNEAKNSMRDYAKELSNLTEEYPQYQQALSDAQNAQEEFLNSSRDTDAIDDYNDAVEENAKTIENLADTYEAKGDEISKSIADNLRSSADSIRNFARDSKVSLEEAINPFSSLISEAQKAKETFDSATEDKDYYSAQDQYKEIYDQIYDEDSIDATGAGSKSFWQAAEQILGRDTIRELDADFTKVNAKLKEYQSLSEKGVKSTDDFYKMLLKEKDALNKIKGVSVTQDADGTINLEGFEPENFSEIADALDMSQEYLISILNASRQFASVDFSNVDQVKTALKDLDTSFANDGKIFQLYDRMEGEAIAAGISTEEFANVYSKSWEEAGISLLRLDDDFIKTKEGMTQLANQFISMGDSFGSFNKKTNEFSLNGEQIISRLYQMGAEASDTQRVLEEMFNNDEIDLKLPDGVEFEQLGAYVKQFYDELNNENAVTNPFEKMSDSTDKLTNAINNLIVAMGGIPDIDWETKFSGLDNGLEKVEGQQELIPKDEQDGYINNFKTQLEELQNNLNLLKKARDNATDKAVKDELDKQIAAYEKDISGIEKRLEKLFKPPTIKSASTKTGLQSAFKDLGLENISDKTTKKILDIKVKYSEDKNRSQLIQKLLNTDLTKEQIIKIVTELTGKETTEKDLENIKNKAKSLKKVKANVEITADGSKSKKEIKSVEKEALEYAEETYEAILNANGTQADAEAAATASYIKTLTSKGYTFNLKATGFDSIIAGFGLVQGAAEAAARAAKKVNGGSGANGTNNEKYSSAAKGKLGPKGRGGLTLTGEEGPEVAWLPSESSSMILGLSGPEMVDLPSDAVVYTAEQSRRILKGPKLANYTFGSMAKASYNPNNARPSGGKIIPKKTITSDTKKSTDKNTKSTDKNTKKLNEASEKIDKLYNNLRYIDKELRMVNKYQARYERLLETVNVTGKDLVKNLDKQKKYYELIIKRSNITTDTRQKQIKSILGQHAKYTYEYNTKNKEGNTETKEKTVYTKADISKWFKYDPEYNMITWDINKLNKLQKSKSGADRALYNHLVNDIGPKLEGFQSDIEEANDNLEDAKNALEDMKQLGRDAYVDLENRVYEALIYREQEKIDKLSQIDESINDANSELINSIQDSLSKIRQDRENQETEDDIAAKERRLAYLRRDTSNANALEIKQLEEELADQKQDYTDTLIDQKISELQAQNDEAAAQRQQQIDLLQAQLDYDEKSGYFWDEAHKLIEEGIDETGKLVETSELVSLLKSAEGWEGLSSVQQMDWYQQLQQTAAQGWQWLKDNLLTALGHNTLQYQWETGKVQTGDKIDYTQGEGKHQSGNVNNEGNVYYDGKKGDKTYFVYSGAEMEQDAEGNWVTAESLKNARRFRAGSTIQIRAKKNGSNEIVKVKAKADSEGLMRSVSNGKLYTNLEIDQNGWYYTKAARKVIESNPKKYPNIKFKYKQGGLADFTGPAWLDGTKSKPELVLNQRDTENFIQLKDVLSSILKGNVSSNSDNSGDNIYEININVDKLENDYDVEQVAEKVKKMINSDARYRNVNAINRLR